ncbi:unnamed protein product [Blepharisma stoltei]|uniref:SAM domain-containing protein n=1 Tax=Blepharisma stoltei TaxID=1481888 RepID=A0AAU9K4S6_9CILI|nr:unnamed protein product [Blepharisma stoltei]
MTQYNTSTSISPRSSEGSQTEILDIQKACRLGDLAAIKKAYHADPSKLNHKDESLGWTALYRTVICGHIQASQFLLKQGADPNTVNNLGETPLHQAADNSQYELAELLLEYHADPNLQQNDGDTPLHHAAFRGDSKMIEILLKHHADPNVQNYMFGRTPLHYASDCGHNESVMLMLEFGGDPFLQDRQGKTPTSLAQTKELQDMMENYQPNLDKSNTSQEIDEINMNLGTFGKLNLEKDGEYEFYDSPNPPKPEEGNLEPESEISVIQTKNELKPIYQFLEKINLQELYEVLCDAGLDDINKITERMISDNPITKRELVAIGIKKPGHIYRFLIKAEEEAGISYIKTNRKLNQESFWKCCTVPTNATFGMASFPTLREWLKSIKLEELWTVFVEAGFDSYEMIITQMYSKYPFTDEILLAEIGIAKPGHRNRILAKLQEETRSIDRKDGLVMERVSKNVSCDKCYIM